MEHMSYSQPATQVTREEWQQWVQRLERLCHTNDPHLTVFEPVETLEYMEQRLHGVLHKGLLPHAIFQFLRIHVGILPMAKRREVWETLRGVMESKYVVEVEGGTRPYTEAYQQSVSGVLKG